MLSHATTVHEWLFIREKKKIDETQEKEEEKEETEIKKSRDSSYNTAVEHCLRC